MDYRDLDVAVTGSGPDYLVRVETPRWGQASAVMTLDLAAPDFVAELAAVKSGEVGEERLQQFGSVLFDRLFPSEAAAALMASLGDAHSRGHGLRIRLRVDPPALRSVPWELAYFPLRHLYLGADVETPLTRHLDVFQPVDPYEVKQLPVRVLVVAPGGSGLDVDAEIGGLTKELERLRDVVEISPLVGKVEASDLRAALQPRQFHVLHFIGHGSYSDAGGAVYLNGSTGELRPLADVRLAEILRGHPSMRLVVLNSCEGATATSGSPDLTGVAQHLVAAGVPTVLAHQYAVWDNAAVDFAVEFYAKLVQGPEAGIVEAAVARARSLMTSSYSDTHMAAAPVLYVRSTGPLFTIPVPRVDDIGRRERLLAAARIRLQDLQGEAEPPAVPSQGLLDRIDVVKAEIEGHEAWIGRAEKRLAAAGRLTPA